MMTRIPSLVIAGLMMALAAVSVGCSMDPPADGVQVKITNVLTDAQQDDAEEKLKAIAGSNATSNHMVLNGVMDINISPVADPKAFADKIDFGKVTKTEGNVITMEFTGDKPAEETETPDDTPTE